MFFHFFYCIQKKPSRPISKLLGRKYFQWNNFQLYVTNVNKRILFQLVNKSLFFNLMQFKQNILVSIVVFRLRPFFISIRVNWFEAQYA